MDLLDDFFNLSKKFERVIVRGSQTGGKIEIDPDTFPEDYQKSKVLSKGTEYAKQFKEEEERMWKEGLDDTESPESGRKVANFHDIDDAFSLCSTMTGLEVGTETENTRVYEVYDFQHKVPTGLPIVSCKENIIQTINSSTVTIIQGSTGCGKTTQVPQYILDSCYDMGAPCNIIVTQPRRLAAVSVAKRVCFERNWTIGSLVGYQVGLNVKTSPDTRLTFCTTGVLLQRLIHSKSLIGYTHILLDEVHERNQDMDFILMVIRRLMRRQNLGTKIILMSATMNPRRFSEYFSFARSSDQESVPFLDVDLTRKKKSNFLVSKFYLCQLKALGQIPDIKFDEPGISPFTYELALKLISQFDNLEKHVPKCSRGAVLVFLPGIQEIEELYNLLIMKNGSQKWWVRPLHSTITTEEQESVFCKPPAGYRKIILSTNIAESSLTVPDIVYVVDFCLTKQLVCDPATNFSSLQVAWASKTNCIQRAGRAGRVQEGRVYRLVPREFYEDYLAEELLPEILRCPLDRVILQAKLLGMGSPKSLLALCLDPPDLSNIENTILLLKEAGALLPTLNGSYSSDDGDLTFLGTVMANLPVDIHVAKLIMLGHVFNVLEECIVIGAALSLKSMFSSPFQERMAAYESKLMWADSSCSDCIAFLNAFTVWRHHKEHGVFGPNAEREEAWARRYHLQLRSLRETATLIRELRERLERMGVSETKGQGRFVWSLKDKPLILKIVVAGAFYPNYFVRGSHGGQVDEKEAVRLLVGRDPFTTVFLQGMLMDQPGELYVKTIKQALSDCGRDMKVSFDGTSKVYVQFGRAPSLNRHTPEDMNFHSDIPGNVAMPVYKAVKLRQLKLPITLQLMPAKDAMTRCRELGLQPAQDNPWLWERKREAGSILKPILPSVDTHYIHISVSHIDNPGHFWVHSIETNSINTLHYILSKLNDGNKELKSLRAKPELYSKIYAAPFAEANAPSLFYRARVTSILPPKGYIPRLEISFIDYGNSSVIEMGELREITGSLIEDEIMNSPPQALECVLSEIRPSLIDSPRGGWSVAACQDFTSLVTSYLFYGKIYSVVHGIVSLELMRQDLSYESEDTSKTVKSVNEYLIKRGYAERADESYLSKMNHEVRQKLSENMNLEVQDHELYDQLQAEHAGDWESNQKDPDPPKPHECNTSVVLKGPFSPLEMKIFNITRVGLSRMVQIQWNSVNSVLLDADPQDPHERLLVAACVGENADRNRLTIRNTTLMPNIHGLPALIYLIFSPSIEIRINEEGTAYIGALCGLGSDPLSGQSYFPDHDFEVTFDCEITLKDIEAINRLRYWMTVSLYTEPDQDYPITESGMLHCQGKVKEFLLRLITVPRPAQEVELYHKPFKWQQINKELLMNPGYCAENERAVYRLHWGVSLKEKPKPGVLDHIKYLHKVAEGKVSCTGDIVCNLCNIALVNAKVLRIHLLSVQHRERENDVRVQNPE